jgi:hypothetical protein
MNDILVMNLRNTLLFCAILSTASLAPQASTGVFRMLLKLRHGITILRQYLKAGYTKTASSRFWEVDMTKFEP